MAYRAGVIFTRCFLQKAVTIRPGVVAKPLPSTGFVGEIHNLKKLLEAASCRFNRVHLDKAVAQHEGRGVTTLVEFERIEANDYIGAINFVTNEAESIALGLSLVSANEVVLACAFASPASGSNRRDGGVQFYLPQDRVIRHGTRLDDGTPLHGFLDVLAPLANARSQKVQTLLRLYRASVREPEPDHQTLFQLILLEEASDAEPSKNLGQRIRGLCTRLEVANDLNKIAVDLGVSFPQGKDGIDALVVLRNAAAHNGEITEEGLVNYGGVWLTPVLARKAELHRLVDASVRLVLASFVGHGTGTFATRLTATRDNQVFTIQFD